MLTPMDIHNKDFKRTIRGYSTNEVDEFLDRIVGDYEKLFRENDKLKEQASFNEKEISQYRKLEKNLQDTLMMAQNTADEIMASAKKNAEDIQATAQKNAEDVTNTARRNADDLMATTTKTVEEMKLSTERECNSLRERAKLDAQRRLDEADTKLRSIMAEYEKIVRDKNSFLTRIRSALESELAVTNQMLSSMPHHETVKTQPTALASMSALSSVPLPTITAKPKSEPAPASVPSPQPMPSPQSKPTLEKATEKAVDPEDMQKTNVFTKSRVR
ncbi:MAG: DivIVA domain-containing protein [Selenomonadaceae bacterium]|nr:DivIVA domain-containing protein [Selenomonadaceae bacterium]